MELTKAERAVEDKVANLRKTFSGMSHARAYTEVLKHNPELQAQLDQEARNGA
ncbi:MAG: hypothetical protein U5L06_12230 [Rhodovibrio sp.]|nr:hypothetical protein [Rhodovibrio sp.]